MKKYIIIVLSIMCCFVHKIYAQKWGKYTLVATQNSTTAKLVDTTGTVYKTWTLTGSTGYSSYLLESGVLLRTVTTTNSVFSGGGMHGRVQKVNWAGTILWDYTYSTTSYCAHHDICAMPNGNVLLIAYEAKTAAEVIAQGCSTSVAMWIDKIIEVQPTGATTGTIVWEWHAWDHLSQSVYSAKPNYYTSVSAHPELMNINYTPQKEWMHMNGLDYNASLDQIVFSCHNLNEVYVIDHSTTTTEAASHAGGNSGKGGDILYRWGNPASYGMTGTTDFNVVHDAHWIPNDCPRAGTLVGFNNGATTTYSGIDYFYPPYNGYNYTFVSGSAYSPSTYNKRILCNGKTSNMGNSQQLPNGNVLYCVALSGAIYEIDSNGTQLWTYAAGGTTPQASRYSNCYVNGPTAVLASTNSATICNGISTQLSSSASGISTISYAWSSNIGGFTSSAQNPTVSPTATTIYTVVATSNSCTTTNTVTINVNPKPITSSITGNTTVIPTTTHTYSVSNTNGSSYNWLVSGGNIISGNTTNSVNIQWNGTVGNGSIKVIETNASSCVGDTVSLSVAIAGTISLTATPHTLSFSNVAGSSKIYVNSNASWTVSSNQLWAIPDKTTGTDNDSFNISVAANSTIINRVATVTVTAGNIVEIITITQDSSALTFSISPSSITFTKNTGNQKVNIFGNATWTANTLNSWISLGKNSGLGNDNFYIVVSPNTDTISRNGMVTFTSGNIVQTLLVKQDSTPVYFTVSPANLSFSNVASSQKIAISSNTNWTISTNDTWLTINKNNGTGNDSVTFTVAANSTASTRTSSVIFNTSNISYTLTVTQNSTSAFITVSTSSLTYNNTGGTKGMAISSNVSWIVSSNDSWLSSNKINGSGNDSIYISTASNGSINKRNSTLTITTGTITKTINISQDSTPAYLSLNSNIFQSEQNSNSQSIAISSNTSWSVASNQLWATVSKNSGTGNDSVEINIVANSTYTQRTASVTFTSGNLTSIVNIMQKGLPVPDSLSISTNHLHASNKASVLKVILKSNLAWTVANNTSWIFINPMNGIGDTVINVTINANDSIKSRAATITFTAGSLSQILTILQDSTPKIDSLSISVDTLKVNSIGTTTLVNVNSNATWNINSNQTWVTTNVNLGNGNGSFNLITATNTGTARNTTVVINAGNVTKNIYVVQESGAIGIKNISVYDKIIIYPNPTNGILNIEDNNIQKGMDIKVINIYGQTIMQANNDLQLNLSSYAEGIYYLILKKDNTTTKTYKFTLLKQ